MRNGSYSSSVSWSQGVGGVVDAPSWKVTSCAATTELLTVLVGFERRECWVETEPVHSSDEFFGLPEVCVAVRFYGCLQCLSYSSIAVGEASGNTSDPIWSKISASLLLSLTVKFTRISDGTDVIAASLAWFVAESELTPAFKSAAVPLALFERFLPLLFFFVDLSEQFWLATC